VAEYETFKPLTDALPQAFVSLDFDGFNCETDPRIINGVEANPWAWIIQIRAFQSASSAARDPNAHEQCGGSILSDTWGITAAHCITSQNQHYELYFGAWDYQDNYMFKFEMSFDDFIIHPGWGDKSDGSDFNQDYALIKFPAKISDNVAQECQGVTPLCATPICLPSGPPTPGDACWVAGWGLVDYDNQTPADTLYSVGLNIFSEAYVRDFTDIHHHVIFENEFAAGLPDRNNDGKTDAGKDSCSGDSGGPFVCQVGGKLVLSGLVSSGSNCAAKGSPGLYANVWAARDWIKTQTGLGSGTAPTAATTKATTKTTTTTTTTTTMKASTDEWDIFDDLFSSGQAVYPTIALLGGLLYNLFH